MTNKQLQRAISRDRDLRGLKWGIRAMQTSSERMRKATLIYLWDRFVMHGPKPS